MKIVMFKDGQYAVRRLTWHGYEYLDIRDTKTVEGAVCAYWWPRHHRYFAHTLGTLFQVSKNLEAMKANIRALADYGTPVKFEKVHGAMVNE